MPRIQRKKSFAQRGWVKFALLLLTGLLLVILGRREDEQKEDNEPVVWRRDIEMGPTNEEKIQLAPETPAGAGLTAESEELPGVAPIAPETRAGVGLNAEREELEEMETAEGVLAGEETGEESTRAEVVGPIPLPEDEDDEVEMQTPAGDDLAIVEGIGPKINSVLHEAGIRTFTQLAEASPERLEEVLRSAGLRLANPETWAEQARYAAAGEWSKLETYQKKLKGGRKA